MISEIIYHNYSDFLRKNLLAPNLIFLQHNLISHSLVSFTQQQNNWWKSIENSSIEISVSIINPQTLIKMIFLPCSFIYIFIWLPDITVSFSLNFRQKSYIRSCMQTHDNLALGCNNRGEERKRGCSFTKK